MIETEAKLRLDGGILFGHLPLMAGCSKGQIGALNAESFAERILSAANLVLTEGNTLLDDSMLEILVLLRINREFMEYMTAKFQKFKEDDPLFKALEKNGSVVRVRKESESV